MSLVMAKDLTHIKVKGTVHLWQVFNGQFKSLTNGFILLKMEELLGFDFSEFIELLAQQNDWNSAEEIENGFFFVDHSTRTGNFIKSDEWNTKVEKELRSRGYIQ